MSDSENSARIPLFIKNDSVTPFSAERMNQIVRMLNAVLNMKIHRRASSDSFVVGTHGDGQLSLTQDHDATGANGDPTDPGTGSNIQRFRIKFVNSETYTCRTWDGSTEGGADVFVARNPETRNTITSQTFDLGGGSTVTFGYTYSTTTQRLAHKTAGTGSAPPFDDETHIIQPVIFANDEIWAADVSSSGGTGVADVDWIDMNIAARKWNFTPLFPMP